MIRNYYAAVLLLSPTTAPASGVDPATVIAAGREDGPNDPEQARPEVVVTGARVIGNGQVSTTARIGILGDQDVLDTPFSVTSLTSEFIANQQAKSLTEVIENDPSVRPFGAAPRGSSWTSSFYVRGFNSNIPDNVSVNGLFGLVSYAPSINYVDRVDIFKGPSAFLSGAPGAVGGTFNFAPKRAQRRNVGSVETNYVSDAVFGVEADLGQRWSNGRFGVRATGVLRGGDNAIDDSSLTQRNASLALDYSAGGFRIGADLIYEYTRNPGYLYSVNLAFLPVSAPLPTPQRGGHRTHPAWVNAGYDARIGVARAEWDFAKDWSVTAAYGHSFTKGGYDSYCSVDLIDTSGNARCNVFGYDGHERNDSADALVSGRFVTGPITHHVVAGGNFLDRYSANNGGTTFPQSFTFNYYSDIRPPRPTFPAQPAVLLASKRRVTGVFAGDTLGVADDLVTLTLGARRTDIRTLSFNRAGVRTSASDAGKWTPLVAGTVQPTKAITLYANYIQALEPGGIAGGTARNAGQVFPPLVSRQVEIGAKTRIGGLLATAAAFRIRKANQYLDGRTNLYTQDGLQENDGVELSLAGGVTKRLNVVAGAAWIEGTQKRTAGGAFDGLKAPGIPEFNGRLNIDWQVPVVEGLTLSSGVIYSGDNWVDNLNVRNGLSWTRVDVGASYRFAIAGTEVVGRASVENVGAARYFVVGYSNGLYQGAPRTVALSLAAAF